MVSTYFKASKVAISGLEFRKWKVHYGLGFSGEESVLYELFTELVDSSVGSFTVHCSVE